MEKDKLLEDILKGVNKKFGENIATTASDTGRYSSIENFIPTGNLAIDYITGVNGIPAGRLTEIIGDVGVGKSALCFSILAQAQKIGGVSILVDFEQTLDSNFAQLFGLDLERCIILQPETLEKAFASLEEIVDIIHKSNSDKMIAIVVDSIASAPTKVDVEAQYDTNMMGVKARVLSQALRKLTPLISTEKIALIFTNQLREKIGVMFGPSWTTPGGVAIPYHASLRIKIKNTGMNKDKDEILGIKCKAQTIKNKLSYPFREGEYLINFKKGFDNSGVLLEIAEKNNIVEKKGAGWYVYKEEKFRGTGFVEFFNSSEIFREELEKCLGFSLATYMPNCTQNSDMIKTEDQ